MLKKFWIILTLALSLFPVYELNAQIPNAGFVPSNIWYSKDPFEEGDQIKIYTLVFNPDPRELSGTVSFFDKTVLLGKKDLKVEGNAIQDISIDWTATAGDHIIFAKIENAKFLVSAGKYENVFLVQSETEESKRVVSKKVVAAKPKEEPGVSTGISTDTISAIILEQTPDFIAKPIIGSVNAIEKLREGFAVSLSNKKGETKKEIEALKAPPAPDGEEKEQEQSGSRIEKPFKYVKLFFLNILSLIFGSRLAFYGISGLILVSLAFLIWRKIF